MKTPLLITLFLIAVGASAADSPYDVRRIADSLLKGANAVKRMEISRFEVINTDETELHYKYAFTILNENGERHASFVEWYNKLRKIIAIEGALYDAFGNTIRKLKNKDILDLSAVDDISLMDDNRKKVHNFYHKVYPYTIEYEVIVRFNHTFHFSGWSAQEGEHLSVEWAQYSVVFPQDYHLRHRTYHYKGEPVASMDKNKKVLTWQVRGLPAIEREFLSPRWHEISPYVSIAPSQFEIAGFKGDMSSWKNFGRFIYQLNKDRDALPESVKLKVRELTAGVTDNAEKVRILYRFLQKHTRYISIQLGIGGYQPFDASYVAEKGYGDCKALSNYMYSLLKEAGIRSNYVLIRAGEGENFLAEDFPSTQFNHAILCVPMGKDTMWLECTSQIQSAGYMGEFTGNRKALLISEDGGVLVNTPRYGLTENLQVRTIRGRINEEGTLQANISTQYRAIQQDKLHQYINILSKEKVKEMLQEVLDLPTYNVSAFRYEEKNDHTPEISEELELEVSKFATITGRRIFISPNLLNRVNTKLEDEKERRYDLCMDYAYKDVDSVQFELPAGYEAEALPKPVVLQTRFGNYSSHVELKGNYLIYVRTREQFNGRFDANTYAELVSYYASMFKADRMRIVLLKKEN